MSGLTSSLNTAASALAAFSKALGVESTNVSNAATPGYAAQRATISPILNGGASGTSDLVQISSTANAQDDALVQAASSQAGWSQAQVSQLDPLNSAFDITGSTGILSALQDFSAAFANAASNPNSQTVRAAALTAANGVAQAFNATAKAITADQAQTTSAIQSTVSQINSLAAQIQQVNVQVAATSTDPANTGAGAYDAAYRNALDQLSSLTDITVQKNPNGTLNVLAGGQIPLVHGDQVFALSVNPNAPAGSQISSSGWGGSSATLGGQLGSLLDVNNTTIPSLVGNGTQQGSLNVLAQSFADSVNSLLTSGTDAGGNPGTALFTYDNSNGGVNVAASLAIDPSVGANQLALASSTQSNGVANSLAQLPSSTNPAFQINGVSAQDYFAGIAAGIGQQLSIANQQSSADQTGLTSAQSNRQQRSGVSLNTEAVNITSDQRAYEATAQLITILNQLTGETIQLVGPAGGA